MYTNVTARDFIRASVNMPSRNFGMGFLYFHNNYSTEFTGTLAEQWKIVEAWRNALLDANAATFPLPEEVV